MTDAKRILLIIGGGIAAYKCLELIRRLKDRGIGTRVILTKAGAEFVTPLSLASLSGEKVFPSLFDLTDETEIGHIELSRSADLIVVAPATADLMARMTHGHANDLAATTLLATDTPVLIAPAMNVRMWQHSATQRNVDTLIGDGVEVVGPNDGDMACGEYGPGRMAEPAEIIEQIERMLGSGHPKPLAGRKVLITAGPTHEPIDPVRYIANRSSGRQGYAIARAARQLGAHVVLVSGPVHQPVPPGVEVQPVETAEEMLAACKAELPADIAIFAAAVADWRVAKPVKSKVKKQAGDPPPSFEFAENPDVLATIAKSGKARPPVVVGFAAETDDVVANAKAKLARKGCDIVIANDVSAETGVMGGTRNTVHLVSAGGVESWPEMSKDAVADRLMMHLAGLLD
ncbi:MAG: bifunctional phosphopantothenoylcysteine decarboxylase/phosphopantothenate--cysteine ligase CoaBC, partial [Aestuariivirgaceae bacterium]